MDVQHNIYAMGVKKLIRVSECRGPRKFVAVYKLRPSEILLSDASLGSIAIVDCDGGEHETLEGVSSFRVSSFVPNEGFELAYIVKQTPSASSEQIWDAETGSVNDCIEVEENVCCRFIGVMREKKDDPPVQENGNWCKCGLRFAKGNLIYDYRNQKFFIGDPFFSAYHTDNDGFSNLLSLSGSMTAPYYYQGNNQSSFTIEGSESVFHIPTAAEWNCIMNCRKTGITMDGVENCRFAHVIIDDMEENNKKYYGFIVFPDDFTLPASVPEFMGCNAYVSGYVDNNITIDQWNDLDEAGCVFLSADGERDRNAWNSMVEYTEQIHYWTCTDSPTNPDYAYHQCGNSEQEGLTDEYPKTYGYSIRPIIRVKCNPGEIDTECLDDLHLLP